MTVQRRFIYDCSLKIKLHPYAGYPTECYKFYWFDSIMQLLSEHISIYTFIVTV